MARTRLLLLRVLVPGWGGASWTARSSFAAWQAESTALADGALLSSYGKLMAPTGVVSVPD